MTVNDLIENLTELAEAGHGDREVRFAHQPGYPLQNAIGRDLAVRRTGGRKNDLAVYLLDEGQVYDAPYAPAGIFDGRLTERPAEVFCPDCSRTDVRVVRGDGEADFEAATYLCRSCGAEFTGADMLEVADDQRR